MKKTILILIGVLMMIGLSFGQTGSPVGGIRVPNATTAFGVNVPVGTIVFNDDADKYFYCITATHGDSTLTISHDNFTEFGDATEQWPTDSSRYAAKSWVNAQGFLTAEVDGDVANEGSLSVGAGAANTSLIQSNTSGSTDVTISGGSNI
ncbi:MAG: hypothetical protein PHS34_09100, partial [Candidatus Omnitrophica bacterium]|nr:hypothetical protein [Candidatus Omnitrophota bacterium]